MPRKPRSKPEEIEPSDRWGCQLCPLDADGKFGFECDGGKAFAEHVKEVHPERLDAEGNARGSRRMVIHLDGDTWHGTDYQWTVIGSDPPVEMAYQSTKQPRAKNDPMRFC